MRRHLLVSFGSGKMPRQIDTALVCAAFACTTLGVLATTSIALAVPVQDNAASANAPTPAQTEVEIFPGLWVSQAERAVRIRGRMLAGLEMEWIELLACTTGTREHEAVIAVDAEPSRVHAALLTLGLEPGSPRRVERLQAEDNASPDGTPVPIRPRFRVHPAQGPELNLFFEYAPDAGEPPVRVPVHAWLHNQTTGEPVAPLRFFFTGSYTYEHEGRSFFAADVGGTVASLVQFGDDLIAADTDRTDRDGDNAYRIRPAPDEPHDGAPKTLPPVGTPVWLVIQAPPEKEPRGAPDAARGAQ